MSKEITIYDDVIDSRDVMKRIDDLEDKLQYAMEEAGKERLAELKDLFQGAVDEVNSVQTLDDSDPPVEFDDLVEMAAADATHYLHAEAKEWCLWQDYPDLDDYVKGLTMNCQSLMYEEATEYQMLCELRDDCEGCGDWKYGETLVRDSYFTDYAQQLAEDIGAVDANATWPNNCIDWERAARELRMDYTAVAFGGVTYWLRS